MNYSDIEKFSSVLPLTLNVSNESKKGEYQQTVYAKQGDRESRYLEVTVKDGADTLELPSDAIVRIRCIKPDGTSVMNDGCIHDGKIYVEITGQMLAVVGEVHTDIGIYVGESILSTAEFIIDVAAAQYNEDQLTSSDEFSALDEALGIVGEIYSYQTEVTDIRTATDSAVYPTAGEAVRAQITQLKPQAANLWNAQNAIVGSFINATNGSLTANAAMCCSDNIQVYPGAEYSYPNTYVQGAFYDAEEKFISGFSCNHEYNQTYPTTPYHAVTAPANSRFVRLSTRLGNRYSFIFSPADMVMQVDGKHKLIASAVPKSRVIEENSDVIYDVKFTADNNSEMVKNGFSYADGYMNSSTSGALIRYAKYVTIDRSRISAIFKTTAASKIRFGYTVGSAYGTTGIDNGAFSVMVDTAAKTMTAYLWNGSSDTTLAQIGEPVSFGFEIANGAEHYIEIEKCTVNEVRVRLYNADCPGEVAEMTLKAQESSGNENLYTGYMRCWGGGTFQLLSGSVSLGRMTMVSTGNQYPRTMVIGDSFVEQAGRNPLCGYAQRIYEATRGNVFIDGRGGATAADTLKRIVVSLGCCHPRYVVLNVGTNDSAGSDTDAFIENLGALISIVEGTGAVPVLVTIPRRGDIDNLAFMRTANNWIKNSGYGYIDLAAVLSTGDSETQDSTKFIADKIHPNISGGEAIYRHIKAKLPEIIGR